MGKLFYVAVLFYGYTVFCCEEGMQHPIRGAPCQYAKCENGKWILTKCRLNFPNNSKNQSCQNAHCSDLVAGCEENDFYSHYSENRAYYKCEHGSLVLKLCRENEVFDAERKTCKNITSNGIRSLEMENSHALSAKDSTRVKKEHKESCNNGEKRKREGTCKDYYECIDGVEVLSHCFECENYDEKEKKCRYVFNTPCRESTTPFPEKEVTTYSPTKPSTDSSTPHILPPEGKSSSEMPPPIVTTEPEPRIEPTPPASPSSEPPQTSATGGSTVSPQADDTTGERPTPSSHTKAPTDDQTNADSSTTGGDHSTTSVMPTSRNVPSDKSFSPTQRPTPTQADDTTGERPTPSSHTKAPTDDQTNADSNTTGADHSTTSVMPTSRNVPSDKSFSPTQRPTPTQAPVTTPTASTLPSGPPSSDCTHRKALPDCKSYLECQNGELVTRRCGWLRHFDSQTNTCSFMGYKCHENENTTNKWYLNR